MFGLLLVQKPQKLVAQVALSHKTLLKIRTRVWVHAYDILCVCVWVCAVPACMRVCMYVCVMQVSTVCDLRMCARARVCACARGTNVKRLTSSIPAANRKSLTPINRRCPCSLAGAIEGDVPSGDGDGKEEGAETAFESLKDVPARSGCRWQW
jgi:hypothetical protein